MERVYAKGCAVRQTARLRLRACDAALSKVVRLRMLKGTWNDPSGFKVGLEIAGDAGLAEYNFNQPTGIPFRMALNATDDQTGDKPRRRCCCTRKSYERQPLPGRTCSIFSIAWKPMSRRVHHAAGWHGSGENRPGRYRIYPNLRQPVNLG